MAGAIQILDVLVCPQCKGKLAQVEGGQGLLCRRCSLKYPVRDGIPIMMAEEAISMRPAGSGPLQASANSPQGQASAAEPAVPGGTQVFQQKVSFQVAAGPDNGLRFDLNRGACRALGRGMTDGGKTTVLSVDWAISLDEETKGLILQYIARQFKTPTESPGAKPDQLGKFKRAADVVFKDNTLSRLHAMIFFDVVGIGILDLVSKNGTFVNGEEIESRLLKPGDTIEMGETKIILEG